MLLRNLFVRDARVLREARALAAAGHEVTVVALRARDLPEREVLDGGVRVYRAVEAGRLAGATILGAGSTGEGAGGRRHMPRLASAVWLRDKLMTRRLTRAALAEPADVYHAHDLNTLEAAWRAARVHGARLVYDAHELYPELSGLGEGERERWASLERRLISKADAVIVPSASRGAVMAERYGIESPAVVMNCPPLGAPPNPAASPIAGLRRGGEPLYVYAGGFIVNRGLENLIRMMPLLETGRLVMIGWGPLEPTLRALAADKRIGERVVFFGSVEPDEVVGVVAGADVGFAPYIPVGLNNLLAAPNKLFEYLHAGLAVAGSDVPDIRSVVVEYRVGALFDAADPASIARAVTEVVAGPEPLDAIRARAAAAAASFSWEAQAQVLLQVYSSLQDRAATPPSRR